MQVKKAAVKLCLALAVIVPCMAWGQTSSINAFSPYSMYGLGELRTPGTLQTRSMGGVGVGMRNAAAVNLLNPAAYSAVRPKSFLFDFGLEGQCFYNSQKYYGQTLNTSYYTINFHDIAFQLPIARHLGLGFSLTPYSSVGYRMKQEVDDDEIWGNIGRVQYQWDGDGDVTEVKLGLGWEIFRGFSIGVAAQYYWGDIQRIYKTAILENITGGGLIADATGTETYSVSRLRAVRCTVVADQQSSAYFDHRSDLRYRRRSEAECDDEGADRRYFQYGRHGYGESSGTQIAPAGCCRYLL